MNDQASDLHVYLDGNLVHTGKLGSAPRKLPAVSFTIGSASAGSGAHASSQQGGATAATTAEHGEPTSTPGWVWRAGQLWVLEDDLNETQIATSYCLGPGYKGTQRNATTRHDTRSYTVLPTLAMVGRRVSTATGVASTGYGVYQEGLGWPDKPPRRRRRRGGRWWWHRPQQQHHQRQQCAGRPRVVERGSRTAEAELALRDLRAHPTRARAALVLRAHCAGFPRCVPLLYSCRVACRVCCVLCVMSIDAPCVVCRVQTSGIPSCRCPMAGADSEAWSRRSRRRPCWAVRWPFTR